VRLVAMLLAVVLLALTLAPALAPAGVLCDLSAAYGHQANWALVGCMMELFMQAWDNSWDGDTDDLGG